MSLLSRRLNLLLGLLCTLLTGSALAQVATADLVLSMTATPTAVVTGSDIVTRSLSRTKARETLQMSW